MSREKHIFKSPFYRMYKIITRKSRLLAFLLVLPTSIVPQKRQKCPSRNPIDEDITPLDMTINYKVSSFLHLHSDFWYNSLGSTCTCHYLLVGINVSQSASPSKLNFRFTIDPIMLH